MLLFEATDLDPSATHYITATAARKPYDREPARTMTFSHLEYNERSGISEPIGVSCINHDSACFVAVGRSISTSRGWEQPSCSFHFRSFFRLLFAANPWAPLSPKDHHPTQVPRVVTITFSIQATNPSTLDHHLRILRQLYLAQTGRPEDDEAQPPKQHATFYQIALVVLLLVFVAYCNIQ